MVSGGYFCIVCNPIVFLKNVSPIWDDDENCESCDVLFTFLSMQYNHLHVLPVVIQHSYCTTTVPEW